MFVQNNSPKYIRDRYFVSIYVMCNIWGFGEYYIYLYNYINLFTTGSSAMDIKKILVFHILVSSVGVALTYLVVLLDQTLDGKLQKSLTAVEENQ